MEGSRAKDFGKELGMVHGGIITLRNLGLTPAGWQRMAEDENLARKIVELVEGQQQLWLEKILARERACHLAFFGKEFDLTGFADTLRQYGENKVRFWEKLMLEPHFLPKVSMMAGDEYPGWKVKLEQWFYKAQAEGKIFRNDNGRLQKIKIVELPGISVLVDARLKPAYDNGRQIYRNDNLLGPIIRQLRKAGKIAKYEYGPQDSRFGVSADDEWEKHIKSALVDSLKVKAVLLEPAIVANVIPQIYPYMPRKDDGGTNTWIWYEEFFGGLADRFVGGGSDGGGLASVDYDDSGFHWDFRSVRPLAVL